MLCVPCVMAQHPTMTVKALLRRRLQSEPDVPQISHDTEVKIENFFTALGIKLAGDGAGCAGSFVPMSEITGSGSRTTTDGMRANLQKLEDTAKHFPLAGGVSASRRLY